MTDPVAGKPLDSNLDLRGLKVTLPPDPSILVEPNYSVFRLNIDQNFDGTVERHDSILKHNALTQAVDKVFQDNVKHALSLPDREAQIAALMEYTDKPLAPRHIVQIGQELSLRSATNDVITFLDAQELMSGQNRTTAFFQSPEVMQWRTTELQRAGRQEEAARLGTQILENPDNARNPEALRTVAMAEVAQTTGGGRAGALKAFEEGFAKTGDYSLGMGALNAALETGNMAQARQIAPLVMLAAKNVGADQSKSFWPAVVSAQAAIVSGDEVETARALRQLSSVLDAKNENGTPVATTADRAAALARIGDIVGAQGPEVEKLLKPLADQLQGTAAPAPAVTLDADETFRRRGYTSRAAMTPEGFHVRGNVRQGGMLPDSSTTLRDKMQFLEVAKTPLDTLIKSGVVDAASLPPGVDTTKSLYDIDDVQTRIQASQEVARGIFDVDGRNLEDLHGIDHKIYDSVVRLRITHAGATTVGHVSDEELAGYQKLKADDALFKSVKDGTLTPDQLRTLGGMELGVDLGTDPAGVAKQLVTRAEIYRGSDTRTNLAVAASEGIGDCRHVAAAAEALVSSVQQDKTAGLIRQAAESLNSGDTANYNRLTQAANAEINGYEMRIYDQEVRAAVEVAGTYNPVLTADGKFVAAADAKTQLIETHMHNVVRMMGADGGSRYVVADSFYQKGSYRMGWVENGQPEVFESKGMDRLRLSGGEVEAVICERDANGKLVMDDSGHPIPILDANGQPKTVRTPVVLESTKYSSPDRLEIGAPGPENRLNGTTREAGAPDLAARLLNPERRADYIAQAEFIVRNPTKVDTPELAKPGLMEQAEARVTAQGAELARQTAPKDVMERYSAGNAVVETYMTTGAETKGGKLRANPGQADSYAIVTTKTPIDEAGLIRIMDKLDARGNTIVGNDFDTDTTGSFAAVTQKPPKQPGMASFEVVAGLRGDSLSLVARVDANNKVSIFDVNDGIRAPDNPGGSLGFGALGEPGANYLNNTTIDLAPGEKAFVINVSDGVLDSYINNPAKGAGGYQALLKADLEAHLKANPDSQNIARFLSERAVAQGSVDNTTAAALRLDANTDLQGKSVLLAVFDGLGHEAKDGLLSSALAQQLPDDVPGAERAKPVARAAVDHIATRNNDLARARNPAAVLTPEAKPAESAAKPAKPAPPKNGPDGDGGTGGTPAERKPPTPPKPDGDAQKPAANAAPKPKAAPTKPAAPPPPKPEVTPPKPAAAKPANPLQGRTAQRAGAGTGAASVALQVAQGDFKGAGINAGMQLALTPGTYKAAASLTRKVAPVAKALGFFGKKIPVVGAFVTAGFVAYEVGSEALQGNYGRAGAALAAGGAEAVGNIVGFGVGDLAREGVREGVIRTVGSKYAPEKSGLRQLGEGAVALAQNALDKPKPAAPKPAAPKPPAPPRPAPSGPPSIYHFKNLPAVGFVLKDTPSHAINARLQRTPDGYIKNLREVNFADPKNLKALEDAINRRLRRDAQIIEQNTSILPTAVSNFFGMRTNARAAQDAQREANQLRLALRELQQFKREVNEHNGGAPAQSQFQAGGATAARRPQQPKPPAR